MHNDSSNGNMLGITHDKRACAATMVMVKCKLQTGRQLHACDPWLGYAFTFLMNRNIAMLLTMSLLLESA